MKPATVFPFLIYCLISCQVAAQQPTIQVPASISDFRLDPSRPFVYLEFDHRGPRRALRDDEPTTGIWLRLKNNSRMAILVMTLEVPRNGQIEVTSVVDEVVPDARGCGNGEDARSTGILARSGTQEMTDIFRFPNRTEAEIRALEDAYRKPSCNLQSEMILRRPHGYNSGTEPVSPKLTEIAPGRELLFSLPSNHVSEFWHVEIPFRLALPNESRIRPPYSHVAFYEEDLDTAQEKPAPPTTH
jgi:hypothetical protein